MIRKFCFLFSTKNRLTWEWKNFQKIIADFLDEPGKLHMNRTVISKFFSRPQVKENSRQYLLLWTDILQKTVVGCPCTILSICTAPLDTKLGPAVTVTQNLKLRDEDYTGAKKQFVETIILISHTNSKSAKITKTRKLQPLYLKKKAPPKTLRASRDLPGS